MCVCAFVTERVCVCACDIEIKYIGAYDRKGEHVRVSERAVVCAAPRFKQVLFYVKHVF